MVRGAYDMQKLRIQMGNRIVGNFKAKLGQEPSSSEEELSDDAKKILTDLRNSYKKITDGVKGLPKLKDFKGDEVISTFTELCLVAQYLEIEKSEDDHFKRLGMILSEYPIYTEFLSKVKGIGPSLAGVIVSEIDIEKSRHPSSLWAYAGLDVASKWEYVTHELLGATTKVDDMPEFPMPQEYARLPQADGGGPIEIDGFRYEIAYVTDCQPLQSILHIQKGAWSVKATYKFVDLGARSRRKEHLVEREYTAADGTLKKRLSITFNPFLKTKLMGVMASSFLRAGNETYRKVYDDYKLRLQNHHKYGEVNDGKKDGEGKIVTSKARRNQMALRYMVKRFLVDLYVAWRKLEGLPVSLEYAEAKLGIKHGG
jgi:hypothetical protein